MRPARLVATIVTVALLALATAARADDAPGTLVRARLDPAGTAMVGTTVRLVVDVLVPTFFTAAPELPTLDVPGAIVTLSDEHAGKLTEEHDGVTWFGLSRAYLVTPTAPGTLAIPPLKVILHPGPGAVAVVVATPALTLAVEEPPRPPGAEHALGTTKLVVTQHLDRGLTGLRVGDAVKRTITITADGVRAMLLPPTVFAPIAGLAVYPDAPHVDDVRDAQGAFTGGRRIDAATYVVQAAGSYDLPAVAVTWWNMRAQRLETATAPAVTFRAAPAPEAKPEIALPPDARPSVDPSAVLQVGVALAVLLAASLVAPWLRRGVRRVIGVRAEQRRRYEASEPVAFARVRTAALGGDAAGTYAACGAWTARFRPGGAATLADLSAATADAELHAEVDALARQLYGTPSAAWSGRALLADLERVRSELATVATVPRPALPPLNPTDRWLSGTRA